MYREGILVTMRTIYESDSDRTRERAVVESLLSGGPTQPQKLPIASEVDFSLVRDGRVVGVMEVKVRKRAYDTMFVSLHKAQALRRFAAEGLRAWLVFALPEGVLSQPIAPDAVFDIRMGGRADRGDWQDRDLVAHFPTHAMRRAGDADPGWFA